MEEREIVHVAQIALRSQDLLAEVVQAVEVDVGEELAGQVADGQAAPALERGEQVVARKVERHRLLGVGAVDDPVRQRQGAGADDAPAQVALEDFMVDGGEVAVDVAAQDMAETVAEPLVAGDGPVRALAGAVGVAVVDEAALEEGLGDRAEGVVDHPVAERRGGDDAVLGVEDLDGLVAPGAGSGRSKARVPGAGPPSPGSARKAATPGLVALAGGRAQGGGMQGREGGDGVEEVVGLPWHEGRSPFSPGRATRDGARSSAGAGAVGFPPCADLAPGLVEGTGGVLVAARVQVLQVHGEADEEAQLLDAEVGAGEVRFPVPGVGRLDEGFEDVQGAVLDAVAEEELVAAGEALQRGDELQNEAGPSFERGNAFASSGAHSVVQRCLDSELGSPCPISWLAPPTSPDCTGRHRNSHNSRKHCIRAALNDNFRDNILTRGAHSVGELAVRLPQMQHRQRAPNVVLLAALANHSLQSASHRTGHLDYTVCLSSDLLDVQGSPASCITFLSEQAFAPQNTRFWSRSRVWFQFTVGEDSSSSTVEK